MHLAINVGFVLVSAAFISPLLLIVISSFTSEDSLNKYGYSFLPHQLSAYAYQYLFKDASQVFQAYGVSILVTVVGSATSLLMMSMLAYALSRRDFRLRHSLSFYVFFTMLFNGGLVPFYILMTQYLQLQDTLVALIAPYLVVPWFVLLLRTFFASIPQDLIDAAKIDGANDWRIFFQMVVPLSRPALATVGLFSMLQYWNDWWLPLLFVSKPQLYPIQFWLYQLLNNVDAALNNPFGTGVQIPAQSVRMAVAVLAIGPILLVFPFVQRFFIRGITLGGLKGE